LAPDDSRGIGTVQARRAARAFVERLGPQDLVAVVSTGGRASLRHTFTSDPARTLATIDLFRGLGCARDGRRLAAETAERLARQTGLTHPKFRAGGPLPARAPAERVLERTQQIRVFLEFGELLTPPANGIHV
jgi:hypothetical protein